MTKKILFISYSHDSDDHKKWVKKFAEDLEQLGAFAYPFLELGWEYGTYFSPKIYTYTEWAKRKGTLFYDNVNREGMVLC